MNKPEKTYNNGTPFYYASEIDTYLTELLAPLKDCWEWKQKNPNKCGSFIRQYEESIKQLAERLNW